MFNIGANVPESILTETARKYFKVWEMACFSRLPERPRSGQAHGGARGQRHASSSPAPPPRCAARANFAAFSGAKMALRALAQSMARELGPRGIHVAHVVIDGAIDTEFIRSNFPERYALKAQRRHPQPRAHRRHLLDAAPQPRDAWTHELDLRPWSEKF